MSDTTKRRSEYLREALESQEDAFQKKVEEKLRAFFNMTSGKASVVGELVSDLEYDQLQQHRRDIWNWFVSGSQNPCSFLPPSFPVQYFIAKFSPVVVGADQSPPILTDLIPESFEHPTGSPSVRKIGPGEYAVTVPLPSWEAYSDLATLLGLRRSERYMHSFYGILPTLKYSKVGVTLSTTTLAEIANSTSSGLSGRAIAPCDAGEQEPFQLLTDSSKVSQRIAWYEAELALLDLSIISAASKAAGVAKLSLRKDDFYVNVCPGDITWRGEPEYVVPLQESNIHNFRSIGEFSMAISGLVKYPNALDYVQDWFNKRIDAYAPQPSTDPGDRDGTGLGRLHYLLSECMRHHEKLANDRDTSKENLKPRLKEVMSRCGGVEKDLNTPLVNLSVFDPASNPNGVFLCPTYLPSHMIRLCEWFEEHLPELTDTLTDGSFKVHFLHIDSEGEFFQLHTETGGSIILFTGMSRSKERELIEQVRYRFRIDLEDLWRDLETITKDICRESTISRPDVVFGGDRAACPVASHSDSLKDATELAWIETDITGWYWYVGGKPGKDFFCSRSINKELEKSITATAPLGFKNVLDCGPAWLQGPQDICLCRKFYGDVWLRACEPAHPQMWHGYPQSGAVSSKNLSLDKLDWTILYYAVADLIKAKMLTQRQPLVDIHLVTPFFKFSHQRKCAPRTDSS